MSLPDELWSTDLAKLKKTYQASSDEGMALALARFEASVERENVSSVAAALRAEGADAAALVTPLVIASLYSESHQWTVRNRLACFEDLFGEGAAPKLRALHTFFIDKANKLRANKKTEREAADWAETADSVVDALAATGDTELAEKLLPSKPELGPNLLRHGIGVDEAIKSLANLDGLGMRDAVALMEVLADCDVKRAGPAIATWVDTPVFIHAFAALAKLREPSAADAAKRLLRETSGDPWSVRILRLSCEHALRALGEDLPLDLARTAVYWPVIRYATDEPEAVVLRAMATSALRASSNKDDRALAARQLQSPYRVVRAAALGDEKMKLVAWDPGRVSFTHAQKSGVKVLLKALEDPQSIMRHNIVEALAKEPSAKTKIAAFVRAEIEERAPVYWPDSFHEYAPDIDVYLETARALMKDPASKKLLSASDNAWIKKEVLKLEVERDDDEEEAPDAEKARRTAVVTRFDAPPYVFSRGVVSLQLAAESSHLLIVGPESAVLDTKTGLRTFSTEETSAGAISIDGAKVALSRGHRVTVHDAADGRVLCALEGADAVTALAFSPDGAHLALATSSYVAVVVVETQKEIRREKLPGHARGAGWLSAKRLVVLADKGKKSVLVDIDVTSEKKKPVSVDLPASTMLATFGKILATAGSRRASIHDAKLAPKLEIKTDADIVDIGIENEKNLILICVKQGRTGAIQRAKLGGKQPKLDSVGYHSTASRLAATGARIYGLAGDRLTRFVDEGNSSKAAPGSHTNHVSGIVATGKGIITHGWDGRLLRWPLDGGLGETLYDTGSRIDHVALSPDGSHVYFGQDHNLRALDLAAMTTATLVGGDDIEPDIAEHMPEVSQVACTERHVAWAGKNTVHIIDRRTAEEVATVEIPEVESLAADDQGRFYAGTDKGMLACFDAQGAMLWSRVEHGVDVLKGKLYGNPHRSVGWIATHGPWLGSVASDSTARVFDAKSGARTRRVFRRCGIFNTIAFSPNDTLFAYSYGGTVEVRSMKDGSLEATIHDWAGSSRETMGIAFVDDRTFFVGMGDGSIFRVALDGS